MRQFNYKGNRVVIIQSPTHYYIEITPTNGEPNVWTTTRELDITKSVLFKKVDADKPIRLTKGLIDGKLFNREPGKDNANIQN